MTQDQEIGRAIQLNRIAERARDLVADGYTIEQDELMPEFYHVYKPNRPANKLYWPHYTVATDCNSCDCRSFEEMGTCKHLQAVLAIIEENARYDAQAEIYLNAEDTRFGCDAYALY